MRHHSIIIATAALSLCSCASAPPVLTEEMLAISGGLPVDLSGSWARDWVRSDNVQNVWYATLARLPAARGNRGGSGQDAFRIGYPDGNTVDRLLPLARLAELITRPEELTISQTDREILVEREDDYAISCSFYDGVSRDTSSVYGREICGWDGDRLVSHLELPDGLEITYRFTISDDRKQLRVTTTVASDTSQVPFTITHFYNKFDKLPPKYQCIETLSMKRVCGTGDVAP